MTSNDNDVSELNDVVSLSSSDMRETAESSVTLSPWQRVLLARHQDRPHAMDFVNALFENYVELHGDRYFGDDKAMICGFATFEGQKVAVISQQKGRDTRDNITSNWGMSNPEGYRKAMRVMKLAEKFKMPMLVFIDTPGAFPGIGAEERGQADAIARNIRDMFLIETPIIGVVIGEGASGGALGVGVADCVLMLENSWYCVISPEGCAAILWKDRSHAEKAAAQLKLTPVDLLQLKVIDEIIPEPVGGAHADVDATYAVVRNALTKWLEKTSAESVESLLDARYNKFRAIGQYIEI